MMARRATSIRFLMKLIALAALNLSLAGVPEPSWLVRSPPIFYAIVALNLVLVQAVLLGRPLRAFHWSFFIVGLASTIAVTVLAFSGDPMGSLGIVEAALRRYRDLAGDHRMIFRFDDPSTLHVIEQVVTSLVGLLPAWLIALLMARRERRQGPGTASWVRPVSAFAKGAVIGFGLFSIAVTIRSLVGPIFPERHSVGWYAHWTGLVAGPLIGGLAVLRAGRRRSQAAPGDHDGPP